MTVRFLENDFYLIYIYIYIYREREREKHTDKQFMYSMVYSFLDFFLIISAFIWGDDTPSTHTGPSVCVCLFVGVCARANWRILWGWMYAGATSYCHTYKAGFANHDMWIWSFQEIHKTIYMLRLRWAIYKRANKIL